MRGAGLQMLLNSTEAAMRASAVAGSAAERAINLGFDRCRAVVGERNAVKPQSLPVCTHLPAALVAAEEGARADVATALAIVSSDLCWTRRQSADPSDLAFWDGHANAMLIGPNGLERRDDVWLGVTLMAPNVVYVDHNHPPEEVYLSLSAGEWWNAGMDWTDPGETGLIYNPPSITHKMRAGNTPFLALWLLPV